MAKILMLKVVVMALAIIPWFSQALNIQKVRQLASESNVSCILVFGDSSVDPGNNNHLQTAMKGNFPPYGMDFFHGQPTGRFCDGRLATDFIAEALGYRKEIPAFLDPHLKPQDLLYGASFASAASGYDDFTANISNVLPVSKQLEYFLHYKIHLRKLVGEKRADHIMRNAIFVLSMGTNDFLQNYFVDPTRPKQFTVEQYQNFLASQMSHDIEVMHSLGATRLVVVGVPSIGCMPLVKTLMNQKSCVESYNKVAYSFNNKTQKILSNLKQKLGMKAAFIDVYGIIMDAVINPSKYGFSETSKGCCGTGTVEYGVSCQGLSTCSDPTKYVFWDAVHPTEKMYRIIADAAVDSLTSQLLP